MASSGFFLIDCGHCSFKTTASNYEQAKVERSQHLDEKVCNGRSIKIKNGDFLEKMKMEANA